MKPHSSSERTTSRSDLADWERLENEKWSSLEGELSRLDPETTPVAVDLLRREIEKRKSIVNPEFIRVDTRSVKLTQKIFIPVEEAPTFNFMGKILGRNGYNMKRISLESHCKLAIQGKGSLKRSSKSEEAELAASGKAEYDHLKEPLHVRIDTNAPPDSAWANVQHALEMLAPLMRPDEDHIEANSGRGGNYHMDGYSSRGFPPTLMPMGNEYGPPPGYGMMAGDGMYHSSSGFGKIRGRGRGRGRARPY